VLRAHLAWAVARWPNPVEVLKPHLGESDLAIVEKPPQGVRDTILFSELARIDRAIASAAGGDAEQVYDALGVASAHFSLAGLYEGFDPEEPHRFFGAMSILHRTFQDFGVSRYEKTGANAGRIHIEGYTEYSPVFCIGGRGYYEEALRMMRVPGPAVVREVACQCSGDRACVFELSW
jgi:predicted hydrocarbon binding protein